MKQWTMLCLIMSLGGGAVAQAAESVPRAFQGEWNMRAADCGGALNDSLLRLDAKRITYYESEGPVRGALARGRELALVAELSGEGETRVHAAHFRLSRDGRTLTDVLSSPPLRRYRCPAKRR